MKKQLTRFSIMQTSMVMGVVSLVVSALVVIPLVLLNYSKEGASSSFLLLLVPLIYWFLGWISTVISCCVYNFVAKRIGGIEFTLEDKES